jgi:hypothetical protein
MADDDGRKEEADTVLPKTNDADGKEEEAEGFATNELNKQLGCQEKNCSPDFAPPLPNEGTSKKALDPGGGLAVTVFSDCEAGAVGKGLPKTEPDAGVTGGNKAKGFEALNPTEFDD